MLPSITCFATVSLSSELQEHGKQVTSISSMTRKQFSLGHKEKRHESIGKFWLSISFSLVSSNSALALQISSIWVILSFRVISKFAIYKIQMLLFWRCLKQPEIIFLQRSFKISNTQQVFSPLSFCLKSNLALGKPADCSSCPGMQVLALSSLEKKKQLQWKSIKI